MIKHKKIQTLNDYFSDLDHRQDKCVYFYRINAYSSEINEFIKKYYMAARSTGTVIEGRIPNPDEKQLSYYMEMMGSAFQMDSAFISNGLKKWLPRMNDLQRRMVSESIYDSLDLMRKSGKTENMLKNAYIKYMCWLYYKFEAVVNRLGTSVVPKILYEGIIHTYELNLISILCSAGCDVVLLQYSGDQEYLKLDPTSSLSEELVISGLQPFPQEYSLKKVREEIQSDMNSARLYGSRPAMKRCTNAWISGKGLEDIRQRVSERGNDPQLFYNCFMRICGAEDKTTYASELFRLQQDLKEAHRHTVIVNGEIAKPSPEEVSEIKRGSYKDRDSLILGLSANIKYAANPELQKIMHEAFVDLMLEESRKENQNLNRLTNRAVYLLCWMKRYVPKLFSNWKPPEVGCFIYLGGCRNDMEVLFVRFLSRLPSDVLILCPDLNTSCMLTNPLLYEIRERESLVLNKFPEENSGLRIGTAAYHAERDLDTLMYQDTGIYRNQQYSKANVIALQTMYEEISILWDQELKYRPNFSTTEDTVNIPVIYAKISGIKDGAITPYWISVKKLLTENTIVIKNPPYISSTAENPMKPYAAEFYKNGKLQKSKIRNHPKYPYGILREEMQEFILDKLDIMIQQRMIRGIGENGTEYTVIAQILNLPKEVVRLIQKFDFTKKNPKVIYINTGEAMISLEDSILTAFLHQIGFDVLFFIPTGYQNVEKYIKGNQMEEHQIGEYLYDLQVPDWNTLPLNHTTRHSWRDIIFKRGN